MQVHQFHGVVACGDATGNDILSLQRMLRKMGYASEIFAEFGHRNFESKARHYSKHRKFSSPENVLLCHFSIEYSPESMAWLQRVPDRKVIVYHNITPHHYFAGINETFYERTRSGREQLKQLCALTLAGWGDSDFNRRELVQLGWQRTSVLPIVFEPEMYDIEPDSGVLRRWKSEEALNVLFVSRLVPNKKFEDLILIFYHLKKFIEPRARLFLVGSTDQMEGYLAYLKALVERLGLTDVMFTGHVSREELVAYYRVTDVYLCMSEHEGFGVTLVESMYFGVPVIAYSAAAIPETMGGAGILVARKDYAAIAELINLVVRDSTLRARVVERQRERWKWFTPDAVTIQLQNCLEAIP